MIGGYGKKILWAAGLVALQSYGATAASFKVEDNCRPPAGLCGAGGVSCKFSHRNPTEKALVGTSTWLVAYGDIYDYFNKDGLWFGGCSISYYAWFEKNDREAAPISAPPPIENPRRSCGSEIDVLSQSLGERIPIVGTRFALIYNSNRGRRTFEYDSQMGACVVPTAGGGKPDCNITASIGKRTVASQDFVGAPNQSLRYEWDSLDGDGQRSYFSQNLKFKYKFLSGPLTGRSFDSMVSVGAFDSLFYGLGGWQPNVLHAYDVDSKTIYFGDGSAKYSPAKSLAGGSWMVKSPAEDEWYVFDSKGRHTVTRSGLLGTRVYSFAYDAAGRLLSITDAVGLVTTIHRDAAGNPVSIEAPFGQVTHLELNAAGFLTSVTDPAGATTAMTYKDARGLLASFKPPGVAASKFSYDPQGLLARDLNPTGRFLAFERELDSAGLPTVNQSTALGVKTSATLALKVTVTVPFWVSGDEFVQVNTPSGDTLTASSSFDAKQVSLVDNFVGTETITFANDPRVSVARRASSDEFSTFSEVVDRHVTRSESYTLASPSNPFSVQAARFDERLKRPDDLDAV